jgi:hypothetical protein
MSAKKRLIIAILFFTLFLVVFAVSTLNIPKAELHLSLSSNNQTGMGEALTPNSNREPTLYSYFVDSVNNGSSKIYIAIRGNDSVTAFASANASYVLNSVYGILNDGSTWERTIVTVGNLTFDSTVKSPSYVHTINQGQWNLAAGANCPLFSNMIQTGKGNTGIELSGGRLNGNKGAQTSGSMGLIYFVKASSSYVHDIEVFNGYLTGVDSVSLSPYATYERVNVTGCRGIGFYVDSNTTLNKCRVIDCGSFAVGKASVYLAGSFNLVTECYLSQNNVTTPYKCYYGVEAAGNYNTISHCVANNLFHVAFYAIGNYTTIEGNTAYNSGEAGIIAVSAMYPGTQTVGTRIIDNTVSNSGFWQAGNANATAGIRVVAGLNTIIQGNSIDTSNRYGILLESANYFLKNPDTPTNNTLITGNTIYKTQGTGYGVAIGIFSCNSVDFSSNIFDLYTTGCKVSNATKITYSENIGFPP